jgi:hypothetical protein
MDEIEEIVDQEGLWKLVEWSCSGDGQARSKNPTAE